MKRISTLLAVLAAGLLTLPAAGQDFGIGIRAGTTGIGAEVAYNLTPKLNIRGHFSTFTHSRTDDVSDDPEMRASSEIKFGAVTAFVDYHPFRNSFRLTGGIGKNLFNISGRAVAIESVCFGDEDSQGVCDGKVFLPEKLGNLDYTIEYPASIHPYVGLGFGNLARGKSRVTFLFDLGFFYAGSPEVDLENNGLFEPTTTPENLAPLNEGLESFVWFPVLSIGVGFRL